MSTSSDSYSAVCLGVAAAATTLAFVAPDQLKHGLGTFFMNPFVIIASVAMVIIGLVMTIWVIVAAVFEAYPNTTLWVLIWSVPALLLAANFIR